MIIPSVSIENANLSYSNKTIFSDLNLTLPAGSWVGLLGPSGVGKSSLLRLLAGLTPTNATISADNGLPVHQQIAYMGQTDLLLPWMTALQNAMLSQRLRPTQNNTHHLAKVTHLLKQVGLSDALHLYPHQLSGGMRQRVALVRTLIQDKPIILMDEPFSALDAITRHHLQNLAVELLQDKTVFFITHDPLEALRLAHDIYLLNGSPAQLKHITHLDSPRPRNLNDITMTKLHAQLFQELTKNSEDVI